MENLGNDVLFRLPEKLESARKLTQFSEQGCYGLDSESGIGLNDAEMELRMEKAFHVYESNDLAALISILKEIIEEVRGRSISPRCPLASPVFVDFLLRAFHHCDYLVLQCIDTLCEASDVVKWLFCQDDFFGDAIGLMSHEDTKVTLGAMRVVKTLLGYVFEHRMKCDIERLCSNIYNAWCLSTTHSDLSAEILMIIAENSNEIEHDATILGTLCDILDDRTSDKGFDFVSSACHELVKRDWRFYWKLINCFLLDELMEKLGEYLELRVSNPYRMLEFVVYCMDHLPKDDIISLGSRISLDRYIFAVSDMEWESSSAAMEILTRMILAGDEPTFKICLRKMGMIHHVLIESGPFMATLPWVRFAYAMMSSRHSSVFHTLMEEDFERILRTCLESESNELIGLSLMTVVRMIETSRVLGCEGSVRHMVTCQDDSFQRIEELVSAEDSMTFNMSEGNTVSINALVGMILNFVMEGDSAV
jgi:hypothetical protein